MRGRDIAVAVALLPVVLGALAVFVVPLLVVILAFEAGRERRATRGF